MQPGPGLGCSEAGLLIKPRLVQNLNSNMKALKANSVSFSNCLQFDVECSKKNRKNYPRKPGLKINPGLRLIGFRTVVS